MKKCNDPYQVMYLNFDHHSAWLFLSFLFTLLHHKQLPNSDDFLRKLLINALPFEQRFLIVFT